MKAADCLREPGDVARRESDGAVAVNYKGGFMLNYASGMVESLAMPETIPGDDWQPLHPAADHAAASKREALAYAAGYESCQRNRATEVKRLTAERDEAWKKVRQLQADARFDMKPRAVEEWRVSRNRKPAHLAFTSGPSRWVASLIEDEGRKLSEANAALTARVAELESEKYKRDEDTRNRIQRLLERIEALESGSAFVGEELRSRPERDEHYGFYWAQSSRGGPELELSHTDEASIPECHDWMRAFAYTGPTTAPIPSPLPTAGDEIDVTRVADSLLEQADARRKPDQSVLGALIEMLEEDPDPPDPDSKESENATPDKRAAALHRQGRGVHSDLLRPVHGLADEGEEVNTRPTDGMSDETVGRILDMVLDDSQCNAYKLPLGTQVVIGKRRWRLVERDAGHPDHMRFDETTTGESYPETGRVMYPSEVQWCIDQGCEVIPPAEPDSPAVTQPIKDAFQRAREQQSQRTVEQQREDGLNRYRILAGDEPVIVEPDSPAEEHRKPECLDGVPAVLRETEVDNETGRE